MFAYQAYRPKHGLCVCKPLARRRSHFFRRQMAVISFYFCIGGEMGLIMKITRVLSFVLLLAFVLLSASCSKGSATVSVIDKDGNKILDSAVVDIESDNDLSLVTGKNRYAIEGLEWACAQAEIECVIDKTSDPMNYAVTKIGDVSADKYFGFVYYLNGEDKTGMGAQFDSMKKGDVIEFRYECVDEKGYEKYLDDLAEQAEKR